MHMSSASPSLSVQSHLGDDSALSALLVPFHGIPCRLDVGHRDLVVARVADVLQHIVGSKSMYRRKARDEPLRLMLRRVAYPGGP